MWLCGGAQIPPSAVARSETLQTGPVGQQGTIRAAVGGCPPARPPPLPFPPCQAADEAQPTYGVFTGAPKSVSFATKFMDGSAEFPLTHAKVARAVSGNEPEQVLVKLAHNGSVVLSWSTGEPILVVGNVTKAAPAVAVASVVQYGARPDDLTQTATGAAKAASYVQTYPDSSYASGAWHNVLLDRLKPGRKYFYRVGDGALWSPVASFVAPPRAGPTFPVRLAIIADVGNTFNSSSTLSHISKVEPTAIIVAGDTSYADTHMTDDSPRNRSAPRPPYQPSFQPRWDAWMRMVSPVFSAYPTAFVVGNHDVEKDSAGKKFQAFKTRLATSHSTGATPSEQPMWYSLEVGPVHMTMLDAYSDYGPDSPQYVWMRKDFASVSRARTPWLVVGWHPPFYHTFSEHYKETECARQALEPDLLAAGVDVFVSGHIHAFERTGRMYNYTLDKCGRVHGFGGGWAWAEGGREGGRRAAGGGGGGGAGPAPPPACPPAQTTALPHADRPESPGGATGRRAGQQCCPALPSSRTSSCPALMHCHAHSLSPAHPFRAYHITLGDSGNVDRESHYVDGAGLSPDKKAKACPDPKKGDECARKLDGPYCPAAQPAWSLMREPGYGFADIEFVSPTRAVFTWHHNLDGLSERVDVTDLTRDPTCLAGAPGGVAPAAKVGPAPAPAATPAAGKVAQSAG